MQNCEKYYCVNLEIRQSMCPVFLHEKLIISIYVILCKKVTIFDVK